MSIYPTTNCLYTLQGKEDKYVYKLVYQISDLQHYVNTDILTSSECLGGPPNKTDKFQYDFSLVDQTSYP